MHSKQPWHLLSPEQAAQSLHSNAGLAPDEARSRLQQYGLNRLQEKPKRAAWKKFFDQFKDVLVLVLLAAAVLAWVVGDGKDALVILFVVVFNAALGFYQEHRAEATLSALKNMLARTARVRRGQQVLQVAAEELVPGDMVLLEAGDRVPADARVMVAHNVEVAEAALTGEAHAVGKQVAELPAGEYPLAERVNMVFMNTVVTRGRLEVLVVATGMDTEMGRITGLLDGAAENATPLQIQLNALGKRLALVACVVVALIFALGLWQGAPLVQTIMTSIALAVATIPEGLPAVVTVTLAIGMHRMAKQRAIVKKLAAVETLGSTTVICSDKTGTLTLNQMTVRRFVYQAQPFEVSGQGYNSDGEISGQSDFAALLIPAALCSETRLRDGELIGDPTEGALLALVMKAGFDPSNLQERQPRIAEIPFDSAHKFMATFHYDGPWVRMYVKGAPDVLLARAASYASTTDPAAPLDSEMRAWFEAENARFAAQALRVLSIATRNIPAAEFEPAGNLMHWVNNLTLQGLIGIIDPPRPEVRDAIVLCKQAGIQVKMITGDHALTASAIAQELGIAGKVLTGAELDKLSLAELAAQINDTTVFARVAPEHKVKIVQALQSLGHVVAMTGDGVNDAPALKNADIGVAMGITGTEVTKEAATMVLTDDNFASIVGAVKQGRTIYDNIVKFVRFQLATNVGAILTVLATQLLGLPAPFTAIQILWINIIMDGPPALTLGLEPSRAGVMNESPRARTARILTLSRFSHLLFHGAIMAVGTVGMFYYGLQSGNAIYAQTLAFTTFVFFQFFNVFNARAEHHTVFNSQFFSNAKLWGALLVVLLLQFLVVHYSVAQGIFATTDLAISDWLLALLVAASLLVLEEIRKRF